MPARSKYRSNLEDSECVGCENVYLEKTWRKSWKFPKKVTEKISGDVKLVLGIETEANLLVDLYMCDICSKKYKRDIQRRTGRRTPRRPPRPPKVEKTRVKAGKVVNDPIIEPTVAPPISTQVEKTFYFTFRGTPTEVDLRAAVLSLRFKEISELKL